MRTARAIRRPGTVTVRLNGRFRFYGGVISQESLRTSNFGVPGSISASSTGAALGTTAAGASPNGAPFGTTNAGINKLNNYGFTNYARLYPGFDGVAANGLKYGASLEIRQDTNYAAGAGGEGSITGLTRSRGQLYFRRSWGYLGTDRFGTLRFARPTSRPAYT